MFAAVEVAAFDGVSVRQQQRIFLFVSFDCHRELRHHIRAIQEVRDGAEALGLALRTKRIF